MEAKQRTLITGGAGFLGSHLCDLFIEKGHEVICFDNFLTGSPDNVAHLIGHPDFRLIVHDVTDYVYVDGRVDNVLHFASPASPIDYLKYPIQTLKVGAMGTHKALGLAKAKGARFLLASTSEVYGDPLIHPQPESYWGNVNPVGESRCLRRGQAVRRGADDGVPPLPRSRDAHRAHLQYVRPSYASGRWARPAHLHGTGHEGRADYDLRRRQPDAVLLLRRRSGRRYLPPAALATKRVPSTWATRTRSRIREFADEVLALTQSRSTLTFESLPSDDPKVRQPDISRARDVLGWQPQVERIDGLTRTLRHFESLVEPTTSLA